MRVVLQRVTETSVTVDDEVTGAIGRGLLLLVGMTHDDGDAEIELMAGKVANLRIFPDDAGAMNRSALDLAAATGQHDDAPDAPVSVLVVSQFTLYADVRKGRRPSFVRAAKPEQAAPQIDRFVNALERLGLPVAIGRFGAHMDVHLVNDGPVTIWLDSAELRG